MTNKLKNLSRKEIGAIEEYEAILLERFPRRLSRIILFGSKARGHGKPSSDVDLLVVVTKNGKKTRREIASLTHEPISHFEVLLSPIIVEEKFFEEWSPLLEHIKRDGITLWINKKTRKNI